MRLPLLIAAAAWAATASAAAETGFVVQPADIADEKAVFATVESLNVVSARTRIGGTIAQLSVKDGDEVEQGQVLAVVTDQKLQLRLNALDAQIAGLQSQMANAQTELGRIETLSGTGAVSKSQLDQARTAADVAASALRARTAERAVAMQQMAEGEVLAPTSGRVLQVPVTKGSVVMPGDPVGRVAERNFVLRLRVPEHQARFLKAGGPVRLDGKDLGHAGPEFGTITLVYPQIEDGRVLADATAPGIGAYFVGERVRVWILVGTHRSYRIPGSYVTTLDGLSYVQRRQADGRLVQTPIQLGRDLPTPDMPDGIEVLSGLHPGDALVLP